MKTVQRQVIHQPVEIQNPAARLISCIHGLGTTPAAPIVGNAAKARLGESRQLIYPAFEGAGGSVQENDGGAVNTGVLKPQAHAGKF